MVKKLKILFFILPIIFFVYGIIEFIVLRDLSSYYTSIVLIGVIAAFLQLAFLIRKKHNLILICSAIKYVYSFGFTLLLLALNIMVLWEYIVFNHLFYITIALGVLLVAIIVLALIELKRIKQLRSL
ncbi:MAG TPA: hypothetical protein GX708_02580 [Gallicola sp.]|jgi:hypothetical protein|nr:hypothetical protein [Gallicola sp.]